MLTTNLKLTALAQTEPIWHHSENWRMWLPPLAQSVAEVALPLPDGTT
jgi:hypothetical protein